MKKISLLALAFYFGILASFAQITTPSYEKQQLKVDEVNFVSSYYHQNGNNSAVTGGIGTEKLSDYANSFDIKLSKYDLKNRKHVLTADIGVDYFTSASSDMVDGKINSGASSSDIRIYPSLSWSMENEAKGNTVLANASYSHEFDYQSYGIGVGFAKRSKDKSRELSLKLQAYFDQVSLVYPAELIPASTTSSASHGREHQYPTQARNSYSGSINLSQIVNERLQVLLALDVVKQDGYLGLPFHRVYFNNLSEQVENLPSSRLKIPIGLRANYFLGDRFVIRSFYRYYTDDWGLKAHTAELELPVKIGKQFSLAPFYRYYQQTAVDYFAPYAQHKTTDTYYTSNYDLSAFHSQYFGAGLRWVTPDKIFNSAKNLVVELRYGHYDRSNGLMSDMIALHLGWK